jgi:hypothetical protein
MLFECVGEGSWWLFFVIAQPELERLSAAAMIFNVVAFVSIVYCFFRSGIFFDSASLFGSFPDLFRLHWDLFRVLGARGATNNNFPTATTCFSAHAALSVVMLLFLGGVAYRLAC